MVIFVPKKILEIRLIIWREGSREFHCTEISVKIERAKTGLEEKYYQHSRAI